MEYKDLIQKGEAVLGIEFGSTRIKAVLIDRKGTPIASGGYGWENSYTDGIWTYPIEQIHEGLRECYSDLLKDIDEKYGVKPTRFAAIGISAMMHGYLAFDGDDNLLVPFRTWRNTITEQAAVELTEKFGYNIPQRWSIAHLYQAILNKEEHVGRITFLTTLAGYVHYRLTGKKVLGVGDASGMFPIDISTGDYDAGMLDKFRSLAGQPWDIKDILPEVLTAGDDAGCLTAEGAAFLDKTGSLEAGVPVCPPEGDAGTGMTATNSVGVRTGNISAGTSVFAMVVLEKELSKVYPEIDLVTTPDGALVGMVHCNNCTNEINAWVNLFKEYSELMGQKVDMNELFTKLYSVALSGDKDCGGLLTYNYLSGEPVTGFAKGAPLFARGPEGRFSLANVMRANLYSALATLKVGLDILFKQEGVKVDEMLGHGGYFKTEKVGQSIAAAAIDAPVSVMETAGEGGAWGIALLAAYMADKKEGQSLSDYLAQVIFAGMDVKKLSPDAEDVAGFEKFMELYRKGLETEKAAADLFAV